VHQQKLLWWMQRSKPQRLGSSFRNSPVDRIYPKNIKWITAHPRKPTAFYSVNIPVFTQAKPEYLAAGAILYRRYIQFNIAYVNLNAVIIFRISEPSQNNFQMIRHAAKVDCIGYFRDPIDTLAARHTASIRSQHR
jgi:hypothetical protein